MPYSFARWMVGRAQTCLYSCSRLRETVSDLPSRMRFIPFVLPSAALDFLNGRRSGSWVLPVTAKRVLTVDLQVEAIGHLAKGETLSHVLLLLFKFFFSRCGRRVWLVHIDF